MRPIILLASASATLSATIAHAQATEPFTLGTIYLGSDATTSIGIDNEDLTRTNPTDLQDVFKTEPTVSVGSSLPISQKIYVNGIEENNLNVTIDGARQNNRIFHHTATTYVDPELLKGVRIDPGVAPADAGPGAIAGALAFETKDASDLLKPGDNFGGRVTTEYQANGNSYSTGLALYGQNGGFDYLLYGKTANGDLREDADGNDITGSETALRSGLAKAGYTTADGSRIELTYENVLDDADRPLRADFAALGEVMDTRVFTLERQNLVLSYTAGSPTDSWNPSMTLAYSATDLFTGAFPGASDTYAGRTTSFTGKLANEFTVRDGTVNVGVDFYDDVADINGEDFVDYFAEEKAQNIGVFAQARFDLTDRLRFSGGARYDFQSFEGVDGTTYDNDGLSANLALDYDVTDAVTVSAGASSVWGGIALSESFLFDTSWIYPDEIDPVTSENVFVAVTAQAGAFDFDAKVFKTQIHNARTLLDIETERFGASPGLTTDMESQGFEVGTKYSWDSGFARIAYANINSKIEGYDVDSYTSRYLTTALGETLVLEAAHTFDGYDLTIGGDAQITVDQDGRYLGTDSGTLEGYTVTNVFFEYSPSAVDALTVRGEVGNLFNEQFASRASYGQEFESVTPLYEPGRTVGLQVSYEF